VRGHADAETLAAFHEELLSRRKAGRVSAHLAGCPRCAALDEQLAEVTAILTHSTAPAMPDALTTRIAAALAAEAAARSTAAGPVPAAGAGIAAQGTGTQGTGTQGTGGRDSARDAGRRAGRPARDRSWLALRVAAVTAAVAVIAGGGYGLARLLSPGSPAESSAAQGAPAAPDITRKATAPRMSTGGAGAAAGGSSHSVSGRSAAIQAVSSGTNYQPARLAAQASALLAQVGRYAPATAGPAPAANPQSGPTNAFPALAACVSHVAGHQRPLVVDVARYQGHRAIIIVLPATPGGRRHAVVVAPGCTATTAHILTTVPLPASH
jgi:hypothetical protein